MTQGLSEIFDSLEERFRIEAVIHDGQYYTVEKWAKISLTTPERIQKFIEETAYLIREMSPKTRSYSYRVSSDEIRRWYAAENLALDASIVPKNFAPKIWAGKSEVEHFEAAPRRVISSLSFTCHDKELFERIEHICNHYGRLTPIQTGKYYLYTLDAHFVRNRLRHELGKDFKKIEKSTRIRNKFMWRELSSLPDEIMEDFFGFYLNYAINVLKTKLSTISIFIPNEDDRISQIYEWILLAMQKFDERQRAPFAGYLHNVLSKWPYDLPEVTLGKELALYQRKRAKAEELVKKRKGEERYAVKDVQAVLIEEHGYDLEEIKSFERQHNRWVALMQSTPLKWDDNGEEKVPMKTDHIEHQPQNIVAAHSLSLAILKATQETRDYETFKIIVSQFGASSMDHKLLSNINSTFKNALVKCMEA